VLTPLTMYEMCCTNLCPKESLTQFNVKGITAATDAQKNPELLMGAFFKIGYIRAICRKDKMEFSNRYAKRNQI
jgi:hypothetical protein